jgi:hypothetical protein
MNSEYPSQDKTFVPIVLISLSLIFMFIWQLKTISTQSDMLHSTKQKIDEVANNQLPKLDEQVQQSKKIQTGLEKLAYDLLDLAKTDPDAKAIVQKYNIQSQQPPAAAASPTP